MTPLLVRTIRVERERERLRRIVAIVGKILFFASVAVIPLVQSFDPWLRLIGLTLVAFLASRVLGAFAWPLHGDVLVESLSRAPVMR